MKPSVTLLPLTLVLASLLSPLSAPAQETPAPPPPPATPPRATVAETAPAEPTPPRATVAETAPAADPANPAAPSDAPFKDQKERLSYGLGTFLGTRERANAVNNPDGAPLNVNDLLSGLSDGLTGVKSIDYAAGLAMAAQIKRSGIEIDAAVLAEAVRSAGENKPAKIQPSEVEVIMKEIQADIQQRQQAKQKEEATKNLAAASAWLGENAKKEGVQVTASGLQYIIDAPGDGRTPGPRDVVTVNITGTSVDGTTFDRSPEGAPVRRALLALPRGLQEGLQLMKTGGKARFWIPPTLGFGEASRSGLKPNSILVYSVELTASEEAPAPPPGATLGPDGKPQPRRAPVTAVTPPVSVEIPADGGPPKITVEGQPNTPPPAGTPPAPAPAPGPAPAPAPAEK